MRKWWIGAVISLLCFSLFLIPAPQVKAASALSIVASMERKEVYTGHYSAWTIGDMAYLVTAAVTSGGSPVSGASVVADVIGPNGERYWLRDGTHMLYDTVQGGGMDESGWVSGPTYGGGTNDGVYANFLELDANPADLNAIYFGNHAGNWTIRLTASKEGYDSVSTEVTVNIVAPTGNFGHSFSVIDLDTSTPEEDWMICASPGQTLGAKVVYDETNPCPAGCIFYIRAWGCPYGEWGSSYNIDAGSTGYRSNVERTWTYTVPPTAGIYTMMLADIFAYWWPFCGEAVGFVGRLVVGEPSNPECAATATGTGMACFTPSQGSILDLTPVAAPSAAPAGVTFPHGMFSFEICCLSANETVTLTVTLPDPVPVGTKWWKYHNNVWSPMSIGDDDGDNVITVALQDGRTPDDEDTVPGQITDQGGPGFGGAVGWETYSINKARVILPWIALVVVVLAGASLLMVKRHWAQG